MTYTQRYSGLQVTALTPESHEKTCGYWYTVTNHAVPHTAFATKAGLMRWLDERGLMLGGELPETRGEPATIPVVGEYRDASHGDFSPTEDEGAGGLYRMVEDDDWWALQPVVITAALSNGRWTLALITEDDGDRDGEIVRVRTVHTLNPNVRTRLEAADHAAMRALMDGEGDA